jgi:hypothetical protein
LALASLALAAALLLSATGVAYAASTSLPGDALYPVKTAIERARLTLTAGEAAQLGLLHRYADRRLEEVHALEASGRADDLPEALAAYGESVDELVVRLESASEFASVPEIQGSLDHHRSVLESILQRAPSSAKSAIQNAIEKSSHGLDVLETLDAGESPSDLAPGQLKKTGTPQSDAEPSGSSQAPPDEERIPPGQSKNTGTPPPDPDNIPPGQLKKTGTPSPP